MQLIGENEGLAISFESHFRLACAQEVTKINMKEHASGILQHEIARMAIADAKDVSGDTLACKRIPIRLVVFFKALFDVISFFGLRKLRCLWCHFVFEEVNHSTFSEGSSHERFVLVHICDYCALVDKLNITSLKSRLQHIVAHHAHVIAA